MQHFFSRRISRVRDQAMYMAIITGIGFACTGETTSDNQTASADTTSAIVQTSSVQMHNTLTDDEKAAGWILLFDGQTMDQWRGFKKAENDATGWKVVDGTLTTSGGNGDLITREQYGDFELDLEWRVAPKGNSGIMYRVVEGNTKSTYESGPEYQIIDDENYPHQLTDKQKTGANYDIDPPAQAASKPAGEFNHTRIVVKNGNVEHWLNGTKVVAYELGSADWKKKVKASKFNTMKEYGVANAGHIALQDHGDSVTFRNIKIRKL
jgi:hypothetical protein